MSKTVKLAGGPFAGAEVPVTGRSAISAEGEGVPEGYAARYIPGPDDTYTFDGLTRILLRIPAGGGSNGA